MRGTPLPVEQAGRLAGLSVSQIFSSGPRWTIWVGGVPATIEDEGGMTCVLGGVAGRTTGAAVPLTGRGAAAGGVNGAMVPNGFSYSTAFDVALTPPMSMARKPVPLAMSRPMSATRPAP